ncbi:hypothetical protein HYFRA_00011552 [Hymenoscyphus fraxineus]|uniref:D-isomer specific 2-hydroxyacid dehydrogenase NAD-binding domain-containing protein n=1 Tax=Hymenoscyphus fraxineus TaxID=746836 RepID=A0A9N9L6N5_9HELO|nr:hypothetical protein HYFRA_00011552 [Hymenoscyphus fraxineus]
MGGGDQKPPSSSSNEKEKEKEKEIILCLLPWPPQRDVLDEIERKHPRVEIRYEFRPVVVDGIPDDLIKDVTILVTLRQLPDPVAAPRLKYVHIFSAGINQLYETPIWKQTTIPFTNSSGVHAPQIAEWVALQILSASHKQKLLLEWQRKHEWGRAAEMGEIRDAVRQRIGILGYGAIGRQAARIAQALGMEILAYTAHPRPTPASKKHTGYTVPGTGDDSGTLPLEWYSGLSTPSLHTFLSQSLDILLIAVPLTPQTQHFLSAPEFAILAKRKAFIVNIARGAIVNQDDLIQALKRGDLRGAALDVTEPEPLGRESELWEMENVVVSPHVSGVGSAYFERAFEILDINLGRIEEGRGLVNLVDRGRGY